ncbi:MAG TPA: PBSX family phage terminase large subunit [Tissierellia bacterium]|nr:PBSX family phage terminase large subunit [Tissierellia bacterium]
MTMRIFKKKKKINAFKFKPFSPKQKKLLYWWQDGSPHKNKDIVIADGAIRSGKTIAMICSFLRWSLDNFQGQDFIVAGKSMGALKRNVVKPMRQILEAWNIHHEYNRSDNFIIVGNNTYYLFGANNEASQDVLQGLTAAGAFADEVALFPQSFTDQMIGRCSVEGSKMFMNCNPQGPYHYFKTEYIDKAKEKNILYLHFTMEDNLTLSEKVKERYRRMFSGVFYKRYILGLWVMAEGLIFDMLNEARHKIATIKRNYTEYYVSIDYGTQNPTTFGLWGKYKGKWIKVKEYYHSGRGEGKQKTDEEYYQELENFIGDRKVKAVIVDPSAASFIATIRKHGKFRVKKARNDVVEGIRNMGTALSEGMIFYNDCCTNTFREFFSYVWDEKAAERGEDKPIKQNDHAMDSDRYFVNTILFKGNGLSILK